MNLSGVSPRNRSLIVNHMLGLESPRPSTLPATVSSPGDKGRGPPSPQGRQPCQSWSIPWQVGNRPCPNFRPPSGLQSRRPSSRLQNAAAVEGRGPSSPQGGRFRELLGRARRPRRAADCLHFAARRGRLALPFSLESQGLQHPALLARVSLILVNDPSFMVTSQCPTEAAPFSPTSSKSSKRERVNGRVNSWVSSLAMV